MTACATRWYFSLFGAQSNSLFIAPRSITFTGWPTDLMCAMRRCAITPSVISVSAVARDSRDERRG